ncbi:hypothetical protein AJ79_04787 [Helicocarpus griseus UAMH5409]|uniref:Flavin reductase like domain-containing protein n=1 Tax=Helicocarpus griseus UAMH5409 TaxID=1447875 RepID=A0A2B7XT34_9EURO|nr:hypothetical protein AJ79_04787 [Helicocarpus griseus UAMH5409]
MLSGCCSSSLRTRGTSVLSRLPHSAKPLHLHLQCRQSVSSPTRCHFPRNFGLLRTILSKHALSITDTIRPVLPRHLQTPQTTAEISPQRTPNNTSFTPEQRVDHYTSQTNTAAAAENPVIVDEDEAPSPTTPPQPSPISNQVRLLMRRVPHPVAIITSTDPTCRTAKSALRGMTVSSFNTVTLYPEAIVSFNVKLPSETFNAITTSSRFLVHLLAPTHETARLARDFARGNANVMQEDEEQRFFKFVPIRNGTSGCEGNDGVSSSILDGEPPRLALVNPAEEAGRGEGSGGRTTTATTDYFPFIFECEYLPQSARVGNHVIVLGKVVNIIRQQEAAENEDAHRPEQLCLSYADTRFWKMGENIPV